VIGLLLALQAAAPPPIVILPAQPMQSQERRMPSGVIPAGAKAVVDHLDALYRGDIEGSLAFVADNVQNTISDGSSNVHFPSGKTVTQAMYLSMTRKGKLAVSNMGCAPEGEAVRCDILFGTGKATRDFTVRYFADNGPITRILSWENHKKKKR
jgi:hypothetical protein